MTSVPSLLKVCGPISVDACSMLQMIFHFQQIQFVFAKFLQNMSLQETTWIDEVLLLYEWVNFLESSLTNFSDLESRLCLQTSNFIFVLRNIGDQISSSNHCNFPPKFDPLSSRQKSLNPRGTVLLRRRHSGRFGGLFKIPNMVHLPPFTY